MLTFYPNFIQNFFSRSMSFLIAGAIVMLVGCADGTDTTTTTTGGSAGTPTLTVALSTNALSAAITATVTATLIDADGLPMANEVVTFSTDAGFGVLDQLTALTNASGVATVTLTQSTTAPTSGGASSITAEAGGTTTSIGFSVGSGSGGGGGVTVGGVALIATPATTVADGFSLITLQATVTDIAAAPIANQTVTFTSPVGTLSSSQALTDTSGIAQVFLTAPTTTVTTSVRAIAGNLPASVVVSFTPGLPSTIILIATPTSVAALGTTTIVATLQDFNNNAVAAGQTVTFGTSSTTGGFFTDLSSNAATSATTDATGSARMLYVAGTCSTGSCSDFLTATATDGASQVYAVIVSPLAIGGVVGTPTITIASFANTLTTGNSVAVIAQVLDDLATPVANTVVTFSLIDNTLATLTPASGTALTDATGNASITLAAASLVSGATTINASAQVGTSLVNTSAGFSVGASTITISNMTFGVGVGALSAFGTTSISVDVAVNGALPPTPLTVSFSSTCGDLGKALVSGTANTVSNGVTATATSSYRDNGCASTDSVTATVSGTTFSSNLVVTAPTVGSLQYVSAAPTNIALQGIGGTETSQVTFKVLDASGNPLAGHSVSFGLSTQVGGITLTPATATATSDANGLVVITVNSGTVSTPVRVTATDGVRTTQSSELTISTGIPDQDSISLAVSAHNIDGWNVDGTTSVVTAHMADHFNNPVPDGTAINFTSEGGSIESTCSTVDGECSVTFTSQDPRPNNGRVTILAYAVGEESFTDLNGSGVAEAGEQIDANGQSTDMPEAFVDYNENGVFDAATEHLFDFNGNGAYNGPDGQFNGVLCSVSAICSPNKTIHVNETEVISLSSSLVGISLWADAGLTIPVTQVNLSSCNSTVAPVNNTQPIGTIYVRALDIHGNAPPIGTTITVTTTNGKILGGESIVIGDSAGCSTTNVGCPANVGSVDFNGTNVSGGTAVVLQSDATYSAPTCTNTVQSGILEVAVGSSSVFYTITD